MPRIGFRSEERFSRNAETDLVCRLLLEKKNKHITDQAFDPIAGISDVPTLAPPPLEVTQHRFMPTITVVVAYASSYICCSSFFFTDPATPEIYTLSLHDALPILTIDVLPRTPGNNVYVGFMVWSNFTATKCRGLVSLNQVIKEIICLQPLK